jgi:hypothetical protein
MASRIYVVRDRIAGDVVRYVRANNLNGAVKAFANEAYHAEPLSTDDMFQAMKAGDFEVLDAVAPEQLDIKQVTTPAINLTEREPPKRAVPEPAVTE